ncbi:MAG: PA14 domain-containing protein, partial [Ginsengibacter sp.]
GEMQVIRMGDFVGVRYNIKSANDDFEIYNIMTDPQQANNLAARAGFQKMQLQMKAQVLQNRSIEKEAKRPYDIAPIPATNVSAKIKNGLQWNFYKGDFPYVPSEYGLTKSGNGISKVADGKTKKENGLIVYNGFIKISNDGEYSFSLQANGKVFLRLHDANVLDADFGYKPGDELFKTVKLKEGFHPITIYYLQNGNSDSGLTLKWKSSEAGWKTISAEYFYHYSDKK